MTVCINATMFLFYSCSSYLDRERYLTTFHLMRCPVTFGWFDVAFLVLLYLWMLQQKFDRVLSDKISIDNRCEMLAHEFSHYLENSIIMRIRHTARNKPAPLRTRVDWWIEQVTARFCSSFKLCNNGSLSFCSTFVVVALFLRYITLDCLSNVLFWKI